MPADVVCRCRRARSRRAFTLVELLVVVSIILALLAILLPSMQRAIAAAERAVCNSNVRQIALAHSSYAADNQSVYPSRFTYLTTTGTFVNTVPLTSILVQKGYIAPQSAVGMFLCPTDSLKREGGWNPVMPPSFSYSRNAESLGGTLYVRHSRIDNPAGHAMLLEEYELGPMNDGNFYCNPNDQITQRHMGMATIAYFDQHTEMTRGATYNSQTSDWRLDNFLDPLFR